jgi:DNA-binding GntR family transcriptional regulator
MELRPVAYRTLADRLRTAIRDGDYDGGRQLPTEEQLAASFSVSRQTVRRAMQDLVSEGIIYRVAGRGTYPVAEQDRYVNHFGSVEELMALSLDTECEVVSPLQRKVDVETASRLRLPSDEICHVTLVRRHAGTPFCYTSVYLPPRIGELLAGTDDLATAGRRSRITIIGLIDARLAETGPRSAEQHGASQHGASQHGASQHGASQHGASQHGAVATAEQSVSAAGAPAFAAPHLGCDVGEPLLRIDRLYFDAGDAPVELAISYFHPEHYSYRVRLRRRSR